MKYEHWKPCACSYSMSVTQKTGVQHKTGQDHSYLMSNVLAQNQSLVQCCKWDLQIQQKKSSCPFLKQQVIKHPVSVQRAILLVKNSMHNPATSKEFDNFTFERDLNFLMDEAGLFRVNNDSPKQSVPSLDHDIDEYGLSNLCCFHCIAECVD